VKPGSSRITVKAIAILGVFAICLLAPAIAGARITVPPGSTEGDQYFEEVPNGGGSGSPNHQGGSARDQGVAATQALNALGAEGQAAAGLANANRPPQGGTVGAPGGGASASQPSSSTEGEGGMGAWFPILLVITAVGAIAYGIRRRLNPA
jgi:hypothetical protein